jgi:murein DD-endopeptidase MepM/ murein hydrolase activator NlpD
MAAEAVQNYEALHKELKEIRKNYADFRSILVDSEDELGKGGPKMPELTDDYTSELSTADAAADGIDMDASSVLLEAASLKADFKILNNIRKEKLAELATTPSIWPVKFEPRSQLWISSGFGRRRNPFTKAWEMHSGVDIPAPRGTPIIAPADGTIEKMGKDRFLGNYIHVRHSEKYTTLYGHMNKFVKDMKKGTKVKRGDTIGYVGRTGRSTAAHVHYEVRLHGKRVNPINYILN